MADRVNAVFIGFVRDAEGFPAQLLEDPLTKRRFLAYDVDVWMERAMYLAELKKLNERRENRGHGPFAAD